jgi:hypothetical protein
MVISVMIRRYGVIGYFRGWCVHNFCVIFGARECVVDLTPVLHCS